MKIDVMTKDKDIKTVVPALRFPEFRDGEGWKITKLSKLGETISGLTYAPSDIRESGLLVLRSSNIKDGRIALDNCVYVTENIKGANLSRPNDILICVRNGSASLIGKNALIPYNMPLCTHGAFMTVFRAQNPDFVFQLFQTDTYQNQVNADLGARINSINNSQLNNYKFAIPQPAEQTKIADCMSSLDDLISAVTDKIETLKEYKKGLMQQLFPAEGKTTPATRFPEFQNDEEWEESTLGNISDMQAGKFVSASEIYDVKKDTMYPCYGGNGLRGYTYSFTHFGIYPLIGRQGAQCGNITYAEGKFHATEHAVVVTPKKDIDIRWLYYLLIKSHLNQYATGQAQPGLSVDVIKTVTVRIPKNKNEQQQIACCLLSVDELIFIETNKLDQLKVHKKGLMQQLFPTIINI